MPIGAPAAGCLEGYSSFASFPLTSRRIRAAFCTHHMRQSRVAREGLLLSEGRWKTWQHWGRNTEIVRYFRPVAWPPWGPCLYWLDWKSVPWMPSRAVLGTALLIYSR